MKLRTNVNQWLLLPFLMLSLKMRMCIQRKSIYTFESTCRFLFVLFMFLIEVLDNMRNVLDKKVTFSWMLAAWSY